LLLNSCISDEPRAQASFLSALAVSREQDAKLLELRSAMCLARLYQQLGQRQEARDLLVSSYDRFPEKAGIPDIDSARELLGLLW
jgi:hypothetical protein